MAAVVLVAEPRVAEFLFRAALAAVVAVAVPAMVVAPVAAAVPAVVVAVAPTPPATDLPELASLPR